MLVRKNKGKVKENFLKGKADEIEIVVPNVSDHVMQYADNDLKLDEIINECIDVRMHADGKPIVLFIYALLSAKLKRLFSISESILAITSIPLIKKFDLNIINKQEFTCEGNMRKFIKKIGSSEEITEEQIQAKIKEIEEKNKTKKKNEDKEEIDKEKIKGNLQTKQNGHQFVVFFNSAMKRLVSFVKHPKIHILDCVKIPVTLKNSNYELSTVINYEGTPMRGYKMGVLRGVTEFGGIIEYLIDDTISKNDMALTEKEISEYDGFEEGDYLVTDRGFAKIDFIIKLVKRGINVIMPVKKNMEIFKESIKLALANGNWEKHPN